MPLPRIGPGSKTSLKTTAALKQSLFLRLCSVNIPANIRMVSFAPFSGESNNGKHCMGPVRRFSFPRPTIPANGVNRILHG